MNDICVIKKFTKFYPATISCYMVCTDVYTSDKYYVSIYSNDKPLAVMALSKNPLLTVSSGQLDCICCIGTGGSSSLASDFTAGNYIRSKCIAIHSDVSNYVLPHQDFVPS